jgi:hypothetical protein
MRVACCVTREDIRFAYKARSPRLGGVPCKTTLDLCQACPWIEVRPRRGSEVNAMRTPLDLDAAAPYLSPLLPPCSGLPVTPPGHVLATALPHLAPGGSVRRGGYSPQARPPPILARHRRLASGLEEQHKPRQHVHRPSSWACCQKATVSECRCRRLGHLAPQDRSSTPPATTPHSAGSGLPETARHR